MLFGRRKRARDTAARLATVAVALHRTCKRGDLSEIQTVMGALDCAPIRVDSTQRGPLAGWLDAHESGGGIHYYVSREHGADGLELRVVGEGHGRLTGIMLFAGGIGEVSVETSDTLAARRELGSDVRAVERELLRMPGIGNMATTMTSLGTARNCR